MIKKIVSAFVSCTLISTLAVTSFAEVDPMFRFGYKDNGMIYDRYKETEEFGFAYNDTGITITNYTEKYARPTIPNEINGKPVKKIGDYAFARSGYDIVSVSIPDSVETIDRAAFWQCKLLEEINIPDGVTYLGVSAFRDCASLTSLKLPSGITSIENWTFDNCSSLKSIEIPNGVTSVGYESFYNCSSLASVKIPDTVVSIEGNAFRNCKSLTEIEIPYSVGNMGSWSLWGCSSLKLIILPDEIDTTYVGIPETAAQIKYRKTANGVEITEMICGIGGNDAEIPKEICGIPVISFGEDISSRAGICEESEEI